MTRSSAFVKYTLFFSETARAGVEVMADGVRGRESERAGVEALVDGVRGLEERRGVASAGVL